MKLIVQGSPDKEDRLKSLATSACQSLGVRPMRTIIVVFGEKPLASRRKNELRVGMAHHALGAIYVWDREDWENTFVHELVHLLKPALKERTVRALVPGILKWAQWARWAPPVTPRGEEVKDGG